MGLFTSKKNLCPICGEPTPRILPTRIEDMPICKACDKKIHIPLEQAQRMTVNQFKAYLAFYEENAALRQQFHSEADLSVGCSGDLYLDMTHGLFRIGISADDIVLPASCLKSFRICEDERPLLEGSAAALTCYDSEVPQRLRDLQPLLMQYQMEKREYEHLRQLERMRDDDDNRFRSYLREPRFDPPKPVESYYVELTIDHPYFSHFDCKVHGPSFGVFEPELDTFLREHQETSNRLAAFAKNLMQLINPSAPTVKAGAQAAAPAPAAPAAPAVDTVTELQRYKALLDSGVITEEEFTAKKRQLLGI